MRRALAVLGLLVASLLAMPPAHAGEVAPVVTFDRAWLTGGGAAVEVAYVVSCPDPSDAQHPEYRHAIVTNGHYVEFTCSPEPRRVTLLLPGPPPAKRQPLTFTTRVMTPQCLYFDSSDLANGEQGCWKIDRTDTVTRLKSAAFVPESSVDVGSDLDITRVQRTSAGGVRLTARFSCLQGWNYGPLAFEVRQMTRSGYTSAAGYADSSEVWCEDQTFTRTFSVPPPSGRPFGRGAVIVSADWVEWPEGGPWAFDTSLHRLR
jgi:hypothetical protein